MVNFFVTKEGCFGIHNFLANRGSEVAERVRVLLYEELANLTELATSGTIFAALDQVGPSALSATMTISDQLSVVKPSVAVLNAPTRVLRRYALLRRLFEAGCNQFRAIRAVDDPSALRYPVFVRSEHRHDGSLTPLLQGRQALDRALGELVFRGRRLSELLIVEFCDTAGADGLFRKYSAMRIGDVIVPRHVHVSTSWMAKSHNCLGDEKFVREELDYVNDDPHAGWLSEVFKLAHIEYGRIDYGLYKGEPQAWEINLNPTFGGGTNRNGGSRKDVYRQLREPSRKLVNQRLVDAFKKLELTPTPPMLAIDVGHTLRTRLQVELRARQRAVALREVERVIVDRWPMRMLKEAMRPALRYIAPAVARLARHYSCLRPGRRRAGFQWRPDDST